MQRTGRARRPELEGDDVPKVSTIWKVIPWVIMAAIVIEVAVGVWLDYLPR